MPISSGASALPIKGANLWIGPHVARAGDQLRAAVRHADAAERPRIATVYSGTALSAGFEIYPEFAGAPFFYGNNEIYDPALLERTHGTSPARIEAWLAANDVRALLVTADPRLEGGMLAYARSRNFICTRIDMIGIRGSDEGYLYLDADVAADAGNCGSDTMEPFSPPVSQ